MYKIILFSLFTGISGLLLFSCGNDSEPENFFGNDVDYLSAPTTHQFIFDTIYRPRKMRVIDDFLLIDDYQDHLAFHVLKTGESGALEYIRAEDKVGQGPGEFQLVDDFIETDSLIYVFDGAQIKMVSYNKDLTPSDNDDIQMRINGRPVTMNSFSSERFAAAGLFFGDRFQVFDNDGSIIGNHGEQININDEFTPHHLGTIWYSQSVSHPDDEFIYLFSLNADFIEKYDSDGALIKRVQGEEFPLPRMRQGNPGGEPWPVDDGGRASYVWVDSDANYIYALYSGKLRSDDDALKANIIHVFDWELNLVSAYEMDHTTHVIAADGKGSLYSLNVEEDGTVIRYMNLSK